MAESSDELLAVAKYWCVLKPYTAVDTRTNLRFDARTCALMITPEFLDWRDERAASAGSEPLVAEADARVPSKNLQRDIKRYEGELRGLIEAGLLQTTLRWFR